MHDLMAERPEPVSSQAFPSPTLSESESGAPSLYFSVSLTHDDDRVCSKESFLTMRRNKGKPLLGLGAALAPADCSESPGRAGPASLRLAVTVIRWQLNPRAGGRGFI